MFSSTFGGHPHKPQAAWPSSCPLYNAMLKRTLGSLQLSHIATTPPSSLSRKGTGGDRLQQLEPGFSPANSCCLHNMGPPALPSSSRTTYHVEASRWGCAGMEGRERALSVSLWRPEGINLPNTPFLSKHLTPPPTTQHLAPEAATGLGLRGQSLLCLQSTPRTQPQ